MSGAQPERSPFALRVLRSIGFIFFFLEELLYFAVKTNLPSKEESPPLVKLLTWQLGLPSWYMFYFKAYYIY
mgnify:CR=1 FL=1